MRFSPGILVWFLFVIGISGNTTYAQKPIFEFGEFLSLKSITSGVKEQARPLKWFNVNTTDKTWTVRDGILVCSGERTGVVRSEKQYENFLLHVEWKHMEAGGNSGVFVWSNGNLINNSPYPKGVEVQMLDPDWVNLNLIDGLRPPVAFVHGELFGVNGVGTVPDNPRGTRSQSIENRVKGKGDWNTYDIVCTDGVIKLAVNGKFVNGISQSTQKKGYICLESEGAQIHFRNLKLIELAPGLSSADQTAPVLP